MQPICKEESEKPSVELLIPTSLNAMSRFKNSMLSHDGLHRGFLHGCHVIFLVQDICKGI